MRHHEDALAAFVRSVESDPGVLGVILTGSTARGTERDDSDVDVYLVVTDERWTRAIEDGRVMYVDRRHVDYPGGYVDVKLVSRGILADAATHADEPFRASLDGSRISYSSDPDLGALVAAAQAIPDAHWTAQVAAQLAQVRLHASYFLGGADRDGDELLRRSASVHALLAAHRALLARAHIAHSGTKYLSAAVAALPTHPEGWTELVARLLDDPSAADGELLIASLDAHLGDGGTPPLDDAAALSRFVLDNEYAWSTRALVPEYR